MVLGGRHNLLINKGFQNANEATNQVVGSSNLSGRANILEYYQAVFKLAGNRSLFECQQCRRRCRTFFRRRDLTLQKDRPTQASSSAS